MDRAPLDIGGSGPTRIGRRSVLGAICLPSQKLSDSSGGHGRLLLPRCLPSILPSRTPCLRCTASDSAIKWKRKKPSRSCFIEWSSGGEAWRLCQSPPVTTSTPPGMSLSPIQSRTSFLLFFFWEVKVTCFLEYREKKWETIFYFLLNPLHSVFTASANHSSAAPSALPFPRSSAVLSPAPSPIRRPSYRLLNNPPALCLSKTPSVFGFGTGIPSKSDSGKEAKTVGRVLADCDSRNGIRYSIQRTGRRADQFANVRSAGVALASLDSRLGLQLHQYPWPVSQHQQEERHPNTRKSASLSSGFTTYACTQPHSASTAPELALN